MQPSWHYDCILSDRVADCDVTACPFRIPPGKTLLTRKATCACAVDDVAAYYGGLTVTDCAWYSNTSRGAIRRVEERGLVTLRGKVAA